MISNERNWPNRDRQYRQRPSPYYQSAYGAPPYANGNYQPKPPVEETSLHQAQMAVERKSYSLLLKENVRGRFLRIVESNENGGRYNSIMVPVAGLKDFQQLLAQMVDANEALPPQKAQ